MPLAAKKPGGWLASFNDSLARFVLFFFLTSLPLSSLAEISHVI
jgi:hypothetical protein